jgi:hypothetical protein
MSIPVTISRSEKRKAIKMLKSEKEVIALNQGAFIVYNLVGLELLHKGVSPIAKIVKGF